MSGGHFDYKNDYLCEEVFGWNVSPDYGLNSANVEKYRKIARRNDPFKDKVISELVFDVFCLMHSLDWYESADNTYEDYKEDVEFFKQKWLKGLAKNKQFLKQGIDEEIDNLRNELYRTYSIEE